MTKLAAVPDPQFKRLAEEFLAFCQDVVTENATKDYNGAPARNPEVPVLSLEWGPRYVRIVRTQYGNQRSAYGFLDQTTGIILKAAGWKAPAPQPRGVLQDKSTWKKAVGPYGMAYLRGASLRSQLVRLAHDNSDLRPHLLPLLKP